jgi:hypothetical protein
MKETRGLKEMMLSTTFEKLAEEKSARLWQESKGLSLVR